MRKMRAPVREHYVNQVRLLLGVLPEIAAEEVFALKGGTAINLFYRDMPRLSVDVDLTYLPTVDRDTALKDIDRRLERITKATTGRNPRLQARRIAGGGDADSRILVRDGRLQVKIETSQVVRGAVNPPEMRVVSDEVAKKFGFAEMNVLAFEDLYGGKLHAALDRQHPRDLFDVKLLYENEGLTDPLFRVFMVYVASSSRPMHELLGRPAPFKDELFNEEFLGMTADPVTKNALLETRARLHADIRKRLTERVATFLLSLHEAEPEFDLIGLPSAVNLPAVRWKLLNLKKLKASDPAKHAAQRHALEDLFQ